MAVLADNDYRLVGTCGGEGRCGGCGVILKRGRLKFFNDNIIEAKRDRDRGEILSCQAFLIDEPVEVIVPLANRVTVPRIIKIDNDDFFSLLQLKGFKPLPENYGPGDYVIVGDIGTTTVAVALLPLEENVGFDYIHTSASLNWQLIKGTDIISRIDKASDAAGLRESQELIVSTINDLIATLTARTQVKRDSIRYAFFSGNSVMTHILLGINPYSIGQGPDYKVVEAIPEPVSASAINLELNEDAQVFTSPCVHGFLGGDIVADLLVSGLHTNDELALLLDLGSNGEMVLGSKHSLYATAFECNFA